MNATSKSENNNRSDILFQGFSVLMSLSPTDSDSPASENRKHLHSHTPGTGEWTLNTQQYHQWCESDSVGDLWIRGIPGCGKSVVASSLIKRLERLRDGPVLYFLLQGNHPGGSDASFSTARFLL